MPDPELAERPRRRRFTAEYKLRVLREAEGCSRPGEVGALLRREGLYTSHLTYWRKQREQGALKALSRPRGRKPADRREAELAELRRRAERAEAELEKAKRVIEVQGKRLSALGRAARAEGREGEGRAMIEQTVEQLTPLIGTRPACRALGAAPATIYRRRRPPAPRERRPRPAPARALSEAEREAVLDLLRSERFVDSSPAAVWATLLDEGRYLASERTMYRLLHANGEVKERRDQLSHPAYQRPELLAERPNEVWSWDISKLKGPRKWTCFYLYAILDVFSRYCVGWTVQHREGSEVAKALIAQAAEQQQVGRDQLTVHADRGSSMTSKPVAMLLSDLGVTKTHSRPYTSTDNPYSEAQFKTLKYRPGFPQRFDSIEHARAFCREFFDWYNHQHRHSGIGLMTPATVHHGRANAIHAERARVLDAAYQRTPERFVRRAPTPPPVPAAAWINKPNNEEVAH
ncbi:MAG: IS3 family transposase [Actinobacteria bacterium]|nr:IS3 family transposase [Actinomycetota bacterium]MCA1700547.1 IS3 family transposase [Actinomycetota bacterium]